MEDWKTLRGSSCFLAWNLLAFRLINKRLTGFEPATFSLGSCSGHSPEPMYRNESQGLAGLDVRRFPAVTMTLIDQQGAAPTVTGPSRKPSKVEAAHWA